MPAVDLDFSKLKTVSLRRRRHLVKLEAFGCPAAGGSTAAFIDSLPDILAGKRLKRLVAALRTGRTGGQALVWALGAHVLKCGLAPYLIRLMEQRFITRLALNGAGLVHDFELACCGETSEDVAESLADGSFGTADETGLFLGEALAAAGATREGLGAAAGRLIVEQGLPHRAHSVLARGWELGVPVTVHAALGADVVHIHPACDWQQLGALLRRDFESFAGGLPALSGGGVYLNVGSAVLLPEVFLKALSLVRNLGHDVRGFTAANLDMVDHYRPRVNVLERPGGEALQLTGHHELLVPLLAGALLEPTP
jgi:hypothetical protein